MSHSEPARTRSSSYPIGHPRCPCVRQRDAHRRRQLADGRLARPMAPSRWRGLTVFDDEQSRRGQPRSRICSGALRQRGNGCRQGWGRDRGQQWLALPGVPGTTAPSGGLEVRLGKEAARWVATADTSSHVSGDAVDIGPSRATAWLSRHGAEYRLCQIYRNEPWHYELRPEAIDDGCPSMYADPTHDPRMQQ